MMYLFSSTFPSQYSEFLFLFPLVLTARRLKNNERLTLRPNSTSTKLTNRMCLSMVHNSSYFRQLWGFVCRRGVWKGAISLTQFMFKMFDAAPLRNSSNIWNFLKPGYPQPRHPP